MSDFHPNLWNPAWSVATILNGLLSFMVTNETTTGSVRTTELEKKVLAGQSRAWNQKQRVFRELFPEWCGQEEIKEVVVVEQEREMASTRVPMWLKWMTVGAVFAYLLASRFLARTGLA
jgi:ubiquitin-conjugating enzyme E2 J2